MAQTIKKMKYKTKQVFVIALSIALFATAVFAAAANYSLFGDASLVSPGKSSVTAAQLRSTPAGSYAGVDLTIPEGITFASLESLSSDYYVVEGYCAGGSPRFQINVTDPVTNSSKNIFAYFGTAPNYTCTPDVWLNTGDLLEAGTTVDTSQLGGTFYDQYSNALANYGTYEVTGIQIVVDSGWAIVPAGNQTVKIDNVFVNSAKYTFESANACKNGGWEKYNQLQPGRFKNQGDCVSFFAKGGAE